MTEPFPLSSTETRAATCPAPRRDEASPRRRPDTERSHLPGGNPSGRACHVLAPISRIASAYAFPACSYGFVGGDRPALHNELMGDDYEKEAERIVRKIYTAMRLACPPSEDWMIETARGIGYPSVRDRPVGDGVALGSLRCVICGEMFDPRDNLDGRHVAMCPPPTSSPPWPADRA
jgi:hypothetical protein